MAVVPADTVVLVPCLAEQLQDFADPASLVDPVASNDHQVADLPLESTLLRARAIPVPLLDFEQSLPSVRTRSLGADPVLSLLETPSQLR